jgi:hypothetical protein
MLLHSEDKIFSSLSDKYGEKLQLEKERSFLLLKKILKAFL